MPRIASHVSWSPVPGELALFDARDGVYHALNASAAEIWRGLAEGIPVPRLVETLAAAHGADPNLVARSVAEFIDSALAKGLLLPD